MNKWMDENTNELNRIMMMMKTNGPKVCRFPFTSHSKTIENQKKCVPGIKSQYLTTKTAMMMTMILTSQC